MPEINNDMYYRMRTIVEDWDARITQSHDSMAQQLQVARSCLDRLRVPTPRAGNSDPGALEGTQAKIEALETRVAQLNGELQRVRSSEPPLVGAPAKEVVYEDPAAVATVNSAELQEALATAESTISQLQQELETRSDESADQKLEIASLTAIIDARNEVKENETAQDLQATLAETEARLAEVESHNSQLETDLAAAQANNTKNDGVSKLESVLERVQSELATVSERCASLELALQEAEKARDAALEAQENPAEDTLALELALETLQQDHAKAQARIEALESLPPVSASNWDMLSASHFEGTVEIKAFDAEGHKKRMGEILLELGVLDEEQLKAILKEQNQDPHRRLGALVVDHGYTGEDIVAKILAAQLRLPYEDVQEIEIDEDAAARVSPHVSRLHHCLPIKEENGALVVAMVNPLDLIAIEDLELASRRRIIPLVSTRTQIDARLDELYGDSE